MVLLNSLKAMENVIILFDESEQCIFAQTDKKIENVSPKSYHAEVTLYDYHLSAIGKAYVIMNYDGVLYVTGVKMD